MEEQSKQINDAAPSSLSHLVGQGAVTRETLVGNLSELYTALREADRALCQCGPNGRNFYPVPGLMEKAVAQHRRRQATLAALIAEIEAEAIALDRGD